MDHDELVLADGRRLAWSSFGDPLGLPLLAFHGAPASRLDFAWADTPALRRGVRLVAPDRPGIGCSDPQAGRTLLDWPDDVVALADSLGIDRFSVLGHSGGGPYALACAARIPERLEHVVVVSGGGRMDRPGAEEGMDTIDRVLTELSLHAPAVGSVLLESLAAAGWARRRIRALPRPVPLRGRAEEALTNAAGAPRDSLESFFEAFRGGGRGVIDDFRLVSLPFGFDLEGIDAEVRLLHGDADDVVPLHQATDLDDLLPNSHLHVEPGANHLLLHTHFDRILDAAGL